VKLTKTEHVTLSEEEMSLAISEFLDRKFTTKLGDTPSLWGVTFHHSSNTKDLRYSEYDEDIFTATATRVLL
jgi:hypothetical protein